MNRRYGLLALWLLVAAVSLSAGCPQRERAKQRAMRQAVRVARAATQAAATAPATAPTRPAIRRVHVFVSGRVQGVGFRAFTRYNAQALKLTGWVMNLRDGRVEAVIEGPPDRVDKLLAKIRTGPPRARVDDVEIGEDKHTGEFSTFSIAFEGSPP
jgi:acylphosphatase